MRKITAMILAVMLMIPLFTVSAAESESGTNRKLFFLDCLNITDGIEKNVADPVTRAEFTAMVVRTVKLDVLQIEKNGFDDVDSANTFASEIYAAKAMRIANGTSQTTFSPDEPIIYEAACKELVIALGYEHRAEYFGSYPTGYFKVASELDIGNGVNAKSGMLTFGDAVTMIYNALYAPVMMQNGLSGDGIIYEKSGTPLEVCFNLEGINGVVSTVDFISDTELYVQHDVVEVSGSVFKSTFDAERFFGKMVNLWYDEQKNVVAIDEEDTNREVSVDTEEILKFTDNILYTADDSGKEAKYRFDPGFAFIKNGKKVNHTNADFIKYFGMARLIDNNSDNMYDYYILDAIEYFVVRSLSNADKTIYDSNSQSKSVCLMEDSEREVTILRYDHTSDTYTEAVFADIKQGSAVKVLQSDDKTVCRVIICDDYEHVGVVSEMGDGNITVDGISYELNTYFTDNDRALTVGAKYTFIIAPDNTVTDIKLFSDKETLYGFTLGFAKGTGLSADVQIKLLTTDNVCATYRFADMVKLDGVNKKKDDPAFVEKFKNGEFPVYTIIRYSLNENGEICMIDTAVSATVDKNLPSLYNSNDSLTCYSEKTYMRYKISGAMAIPNYILSNSIIFTVPTELSTNSKKIYDDECFKIGSVASMMNDRDYVMSAYDLNEAYYPSVVVVFANKSTTDTFDLPNDNAIPFMVANVTDSVDADGERVKKLYGVSGGRYCEYYIPLFLADELSSNGKMPAKGDIVRVSVSGDTVRGLTRDVKVSSGNVSVDYTESGVSKEANALVTYIGGELVAKDGGAVVLDADQKPSVASGAYVNNIAPVPLGNPSYTVYDMKTGEVYPGKNESLQLSGERKQYVVCHLQYYRALGVYIYVE